MSSDSVPHDQDNQLLARATACTKDNDFAGAIGHLKSLLQSYPEHEIANGMLAAVYAELGMTGRAIEYFQRALTINPDNLLARFQLGLLQLRAERPREALETWKPALADRHDFAIHYHCGATLLRLEEPDAARPILQEAARRMPKDHALFPQLHELLRHLNG